MLVDGVAPNLRATPAKPILVEIDLGPRRSDLEAKPGQLVISDEDGLRRSMAGIYCAFADPPIAHGDC